MKTPNDVIKLKADWEHDPCWDIELTEGFEEYHDGLLAYRKEMEKVWAMQRLDKLQKRTKELNCSLELAEYIIRLEKRLDDMNEVLESIYFRS